MEVDINYCAVLAAGLSTMVVGSIWYTPKVFGNTWMRLGKIKMNEHPTSTEMAWMYGSTLLASLVTAYILAHVTFLSNHFFNNSFLQDALTTAFWLWLGMTAARMWTHGLFENRRKKFIVLNVAHELVTFMVMGLIIGLIGIS